MRTALLVCLLAGCSGNPDSETNADKTKQPDAKKTDTPKDQVGPHKDIKLTAWPKLTTENIGSTLSDKKVLSILDADGTVTGKKASFGDGWKFDTMIDGHGRGSISIQLLMKDASESHNQMQVYARRNLVKHGSGGSGKMESVDLSKFGVAAFWKEVKSNSHLEIWTKHRALTISTEKMFGKQFTDRAAKKKAAIAIATLLFEELAE